jgi:DUF971 family protein
LPCILGRIEKYIKVILNLVGMRSKENAQFVDAYNDYIAHLAPQGHMITYDLAEMVDILSPFSDTNTFQVNAHWEQHLHMMVEGAKANGDILELNMSGPYLVKPVFLEAHHFDNNPDYDFMRMGFQGLHESGMNDSKRLFEIGFEEYLDIDGDLYDRGALDQGFLGYDEVGDEIPIPPNMKHITRFVRDDFFTIVSKGGVLNDSQAEYEKTDVGRFGDYSRYFRRMQEAPNLQGNPVAQLLSIKDK